MKPAQKAVLFAPFLADGTNTNPLHASGREGAWQQGQQSSVPRLAKL
jgi:hypothetical protein